MARSNPDTNRPPFPPEHPLAYRPSQAELRFHWELVSAYEGSPSASEFLASGWEPISVTLWPGQLPRVWFKRQVVG